MDVNYSKVVLKALAEIRAHQMVAAKFNEQTEGLYSPDYVHAVMKSVYPLFHEDVEGREDLNSILASLPFFETYDVGYEQVNNVAKYLDQKMLAEENVTFRELEAHYGQGQWQGRHLRSDLIDILRYFYLSGTFSEMWDGIMSDVPVEAHGITAEWTHDDIPIR